MTTLVERQREVEAQLEQFGLRLDRTIEVNRDIEPRVREALISEQDDRFDVVFERLQVVGEMVKRNEELIVSATSEQTLRDEVLQEIAVWREEHGRIDSRLAALEGGTEACSRGWTSSRGTSPCSRAATWPGGARRGHPPRHRGGGRPRA